MTTVVDIVSRALRILRVVDPDEAVEGRRFDNGMKALNAMMAAWEAYGRALGWSPVSNPADPMPTAPEFDEAIAYNLACKLRPEYGVTISPDTIEFAKSGLALIRTTVEANTYARLELDLPRADSDRFYGSLAAFNRGW